MKDLADFENKVINMADSIGLMDFELEQNRISLVPDLLDGTVDSKGNVFSIANMSNRVGVSRQQLYKIFSGESLPKVDTAIKISRYVSECMGCWYSVEDLWHMPL